MTGLVEYKTQMGGEMEMEKIVMNLNHWLQRNGKRQESNKKT